MDKLISIPILVVTDSVDDWVKDLKTVFGEDIPCFENRYGIIVDTPCASYRIVNRYIPGISRRYSTIILDKKVNEDVLEVLRSLLCPIQHTANAI